MGLSDDLPEDFDGKEAFARFKDVTDLAKSYKELERKLGSSLPRPTSEEGMAELMRKLGAPESPDGYELPPTVDPNSIAGLQQWAAEARLTPKQFARVAEQMHNAAADHFEQQRTSHEKKLTEVQKLYGDAFGEAQARVVKALEAMPEAERAEFNPEDPAHFRLLERLGRTEGKPTSLAPTKGTGGPMLTFDPKVVASEARTILESEAYRDRFHPEHQRAKDEYGSRAYKLFEAGFKGAYDDRLNEQSSIWSRR